MHHLKRFWNFLKEDTWQSWLVSLVLIVIVIKLVFFPLLSLLTGTSLPLVVVESCSMYHATGFESWWNSNSVWYEEHNITKEDFEDFPFKNGLNKGDIIIVLGDHNPEVGEIIIFTPNTNARAAYPIIHRVITDFRISTKGDNNREQLTGNNNLQGVDETLIGRDRLVGKAVARIPIVGWVKLIFFEPLKPRDLRGLCK
ncbi:S26 family signal peptidase [Candidatus Pacearchaeota archaeon]|nr:S26 family signal peptidase [Candidatus Pacearchaeota archaeon]